MLDEHYQPGGYNIGINCGKAAGQTVFHVHIHLIPRYDGDMGGPTWRSWGSNTRKADI